MSARLQTSEPALSVKLRSLHAGALDAVLAIERQAYEFPWSRENFLSSWAAGYWMQGLWLHGPAVEPQLVGYMVVMEGVDELHLLNITVLPALQGRGLGQRMLQALQAHARHCMAAQIWLEVRLSNTRAQQLYRRCGYVDVHVRNNYYPASVGHGGREDAQVMRLVLSDIRA